MATQTQAKLHIDPALPAPAEAAAPAPAAPKRRTLLIASIVAGILVTAGVLRYLSGRHHVTDDNAQVEGHITTIAPKVQAFVSQIRVDDNQAVHAGDTLIVLDDRDLQVRLRQAEAELAAARASVDTRSGIGQAAAQLAWSQSNAASAKAAVTAAEASLKKASSDLERYRTLAAQQIVPAQQLDAAQASYDAAEANLEAARRSAAAADNQVTSFNAALRMANARLAEAQSTLDNARLQLSYTRITAPIDGIVAKRGVEAGSLVQVGQNVMSLIPTSGLWVTANLKETELADVTVGDPVSFSVDAYPGRTFKGHVESLSPATGAKFALLPPDNATGNFTKVVQRVPVKIAVDGPEDPTHPLRPGMSVVVDITTK